MTSPAESRFVYVTFIRTTPEKLWSALTTPDFMAQYWFGAWIETDWKVGASWRMVHPDGRVTDRGEILELEAPKHLVLAWHHEWKPELKAEGEARCVFELEPVEGAVKLTVTHTIARAESKLIEAVGGGWPRILSNLKSLLETGAIVLKG